MKMYVNDKIKHFYYCPTNCPNPSPRSKTLYTALHSTEQYITEYCKFTYTVHCIII